MVITKRDIQLLKFINEVGFCNILHIEQFLNLTRRRSYQLIERLQKAALVRRVGPYFGRYHIYLLTIPGAAYTDLPALIHVPISKFAHDLKLIQLYFELRTTYPEAALLTERQLAQQKYGNGVGQKGHLADGLLLFSDKRVAIELELSVKSRRRLEKIFAEYGTQFDIDEVWYFCASNLKHLLLPYTVQWPFLKLISIEEFLHESAAS